MERLTLKDCTIPVGNHAIASVKAAVKYFARQNKKGYVTLEVTMPSNEPIYLWVCRDNGHIIATMSVFTDDKSVTPDMSNAREVDDNELICYRDHFYRAYINMEGLKALRSCVIFADEISVRKAMALKGYHVLSVSLVQLYNDTGGYLASGWYITCSNAPDSLIYVDLQDGLQNIDFSKGNVSYNVVGVGRRFSAHGVWYELCVDEYDRFFIIKSKIQVHRTKKYKK